jgi:tRNA(fMet)-specific endonuclease VapC
VKRYLLDTNILLAYLRSHDLYRQIEKDHQLASSDAVILISVATKAELMSIARQNNWGEKKIRQLDVQLAKLIIIDINDADQDLMKAYASIDAFSQGRLDDKLLGTSARNMGKNDLWIAASAHVTNSVLITTDGDFDHLNGHFIHLFKYPSS